MERATVHYQKAKQQLDHLYQECKRLQQNQTSDLNGQKVAMAYALMGFHQNQRPDVKMIKLRYKQLSKFITLTCMAAKKR